MKVIVVGGGAAGMMAALTSAELGNSVTLIEKNEKLGKKLYITGKGRCNLANACGDEDFFKNVVTNPKFLYSAYYGFNAKDTFDFFENRRLPLKIERGNRVFPKSDHSSDVIGVFKRELDRLGVEVLFNTRVTEILVGDPVGDRNMPDDDGDDKDCSDGGRGFAGDEFGDGRGLHNIACGVSVITNGRDKRQIKADKIILATGGKSYKSCGADGDTWVFAEKLNIKASDAEPSLVPLEVKEQYVKDLQGLSLKNVSVELSLDDRPVYSGFGEMLFTHFGLSGPLILTASTYIKERMYSGKLVLSIDLKPALSEDELDRRILRDFNRSLNKQFINSLSGLLPAKLIPVIVKLSGIDERKQVNSVTKEERAGLVKLIKDLKFTITGNRGFDEAIITRGGISVKEINPKTMESKKYKGLYFAGEMIDVDCLTGGFNLQAAWSTGRRAGQSEEF